MRPPPPSAMRIGDASADVIVFPRHRARQEADESYSPRVLALVYGSLLCLSLGFWAAVLSLVF